MKVVGSSPIAGTRSEFISDAGLQYPSDMAKVVTLTTNFTGGLYGKKNKFTKQSCEV